MMSACGARMAKAKGSLFGVLFAAVILVVPGPAFAATIFDAAPEEMLRLASAARQKFNLSASQATLWFQAEAKTREILRERQARRERLLAEMAAGLNAPAGLRAAAKEIAAEEEVSLQETRLIGDIWLAIDDALDSAQRAGFRAEIRALMRWTAPSAEARHEAAPNPAPSGGRRGRSGGMGGEFGGGIWSITRPSDQEIDTISYNDIRVVVGFERKILNGLATRFETGYVFARELDYQSDTPDVSLDDTMMARVGVTY